MKNQNLYNFPIIREEVKNSAGKDSGYDLIFREDTGVNLGVVSRDYQVVEHSQAINSVLEECKKRRIEVECVKTEMSKNGARLFSSFKAKTNSDIGIPLPAKKVGDLVSPGFMILNSYDRSIRFSVESFIFRLVCTNGLTVQDEVYSQRKRHTSKLDVNEMVNNFAESFEQFDEIIIPQIARTTQVEINDKGLEEELNLIPGWMQDKSIEYLEQKGFVSIDEDDSLIIESTITKWELLNAFTFILTHDTEVNPQHRFNLTKQISNRFLS